MLEALHGFKAAWYLNVGEETRRLMWRLGHAHGTFLALVNLAFALAVDRAGGGDARWCRVASPCLLGASLALPGGFFLGGFGAQGGDPGVGVFVLPLGALLLIIALASTAWGVWRATAAPD